LLVGESGRAADVAKLLEREAAIIRAA